MNPSAGPSGNVEEILISMPLSDPAEERAPDMQTSTAALTQSGRTRLRRIAFEIFDRRLLSVRNARVFRPAREHTVDIRILDPAPKRRPRISRFYASAVIVVAATAGLARYTDLIPASATLPTLVWAGAGAALLTILGAIRSQDRLVFYSHHGRAPLVAFLHGAPDRRTFQTFVDALSGCIRQAKDNLAGNADALSHELREHRRLFEQGAISEKCYGRVKKRLLGLHR